MHIISLRLRVKPFFSLPFLRPKQKHNDGTEKSTSTLEATWSQGTRIYSGVIKSNMEDVLLAFLLTVKLEGDIRSGMRESKCQR